MPSANRNSRSERRSSTRRSARLSQSALSDDDYDLTANAVSDGFRPTANNRPNAPTQTSPQSPLLQRNQIPNLPLPPTPVASSPLKGLDGFNRPSSVSKPPRLHDSLTLRNDGLTSTRPGQSSSSSSSVNADAQYQGATQPSHPYQMYPQRTYSNATASTGPSTETLEAAQGPTHAYGLYTQSTTTPEDPTQRPIPVGFNGMWNGYRRQLGPDGEEAGDLIGPLGHMEELPPYTRYPDDPFQDKPATEDENTPAPVAVVDVAGATPIGLTTSSPVENIPGAGGIGLATRNPEFSSTEDLSALPHRSAPSVRSRTSLESYHEINGAARDFAEKPSPSKWQRRARKKLWGVVPYWAICLLVSGIVVMGVVMGTVIGTIVTRHRGSNTKGDGQYDKSPPSTNNIVPLTRRPSGLPPLPTGCYSLPAMDKYQVPKSCIKNSSQTPSWSCDMPFRWYSMNVTRLFQNEDTRSYALKLAPFDPRSSKYIFGTQPPEISSFQPLMLVKDTDELGRGPAWYLEVEYNKTVMVREDQLTVPDKTSSKRHWGHSSGPVPGFDKSRYNRKALAATDGDKPWICTWPSIRLQVFIYPNQTLAPSRTTSTPDPWSSVTPTPTPSHDGPPGPPPPPPPKFKEPYPKLVKFVERRPYNIPDYAPATCTQYKIINDGQDKIPVMRDGKPVTFRIDEGGKGGTKDAMMQHLRASERRDVSFLEDRDMDPSLCGCVSFSWSV